MRLKFCACNEGLVSAEGIESTLKRKINDMQEHGWRKST